MSVPNLVYLDQHSIRGINFYWDRRGSYGLTEQELTAVGISDNRVQVHADMIVPLQRVDRELRNIGYELYVKEGYRPSALYDLIFKKRVQSHGQEDANRLFNMDDRPHATGLSVDVTLWDTHEEAEIFLRNGEDGTDALFVDYYKGKSDEQSQWYQMMQEKIIFIMMKYGFRLGKKQEYFHFDFRPDEPYNYPVPR